MRGEHQQMGRRTPNLRTPSISLDRSGKHALHRQLYNALRTALACGELREGQRLPSSRALARMLGISRNTVLAAYEELMADGLIEARRGSGSYVSILGANRELRGILLCFAPRFTAQLDWAALLSAAHFPSRQAPFVDPDGNALYLFDSRQAAAR